MDHLTISTHFHLNSVVRRVATRLLLSTAVITLLTLPAMADDATTDKPKEPKPPVVKKEKPKDPYAWQSMFDGKKLGKWEPVVFGGDGEIYVDKKTIVMEMGAEMTGMRWAGEFPKMNYEFECEAKRTLGIDFFCTTTFPYGDDPCSLVVGGWAGTVIGLSCVDWYDASENETTDFFYFKDETWYKIRLRVTEKKIEAWVDDEKLLDFETEGHKISIRPEVDLCKPFGISTWCTEGVVRKPRMRLLKPEEIAEIGGKKKQ